MPSADNRPLVLLLRADGGNGRDAGADGGDRRDLYGVPVIR